MKIGIIGAGKIGAALVRQYSRAGHEVKVTNASGIEKLKELENETGANAVLLNDVASEVEVLVISIPFAGIPALARPLGRAISEKTVIVDTGNYYPLRDGRIDEIENGQIESVWVSNYFSKSVIKVYNSILAGSLVLASLPKGNNNRIALPVSGDNTREKEIVMSLVNDSGFDALDIGDLSQSWRQQPGAPIYCTDLNLAQLKQNIGKADRAILPGRRDLALQFILKQNPAAWSKWYKDCVANNRLVFETDLED
jgi:8-hydroxy-5-deazaflavin:NADPH oxidoreductase